MSSGSIIPPTTTTAAAPIIYNNSAISTTSASPISSHSTSPAHQFVFFTNNQNPKEVQNYTSVSQEQINTSTTASAHDSISAVSNLPLDVKSQPSIPYSNNNTPSVNHFPIVSRTNQTFGDSIPNNTYPASFPSNVPSSMATTSADSSFYSSFMTPDQIVPPVTLPTQLSHNMAQMTSPDNSINNNSNQYKQNDFPTTQQFNTPIYPMQPSNTFSQPSSSISHSIPKVTNGSSSNLIPAPPMPSHYSNPQPIQPPALNNYSLYGTSNTITTLPPSPSSSQSMPVSDDLFLPPHEGIQQYPTIMCPDTPDNPNFIGNNAPSPTKHLELDVFPFDSLHKEITGSDIAKTTRVSTKQGEDVTPVSATFSLLGRMILDLGDDCLLPLKVGDAPNRLGIKMAAITASRTPHLALPDHPVARFRKQHPGQPLPYNNLYSNIPSDSEIHLPESVPETEMAEDEEILQMLSSFFYRHIDTFMSIHTSDDKFINIFRQKAEQFAPLRYAVCSLVAQCTAYNRILSNTGDLEANERQYEKFQALSVCLKIMAIKGLGSSLSSIGVTEDSLTCILILAHLEWIDQNWSTWNSHLDGATQGIFEYLDKHGISAVMNFNSTLLFDKLPDVSDNHKKFDYKPFQFLGYNLKAGMLSNAAPIAKDSGNNFDFFLSVFDMLGFQETMYSITSYYQSRMLSLYSEYWKNNASIETSATPFCSACRILSSLLARVSHFSTTCKSNILANKRRGDNSPILEQGFTMYNNSIIATEQLETFNAIWDQIAEFEDNILNKLPPIKPYITFIRLVHTCLKLYYGLRVEMNNAFLDPCVFGTATTSPAHNSRDLRETIMPLRFGPKYRREMSEGTVALKNEAYSYLRELSKSGIDVYKLSNVAVEKMADGTLRVVDPADTTTNKSGYGPSVRVEYGPHLQIYATGVCAFFADTNEERDLVTRSLEDIYLKNPISSVGHILELWKFIWKLRPVKPEDEEGGETGAGTTTAEQVNSGSEYNLHQAFQKMADFLVSEANNQLNGEEEGIGGSNTAANTTTNDTNANIFIPSSVMGTGGGGTGAHSNIASSGSPSSTRVNVTTSINSGYPNDDLTSLSSSSVSSTLTHHTVPPSSSVYSSTNGGGEPNHHHHIVNEENQEDNSFENNVTLKQNLETIVTILNNMDFKTTVLVTDPVTQQKHYTIKQEYKDFFLMLSKRDLLSLIVYLVGPIVCF